MSNPVIPQPQAVKALRGLILAVPVSVLLWIGMVRLGIALF